MHSLLFPLLALEIYLISRSLDPDGAAEDWLVVYSFALASLVRSLSGTLLVGYSLSKQGYHIIHESDIRINSFSSALGLTSKPSLPSFIFSKQQSNIISLRFVLTYILF